jgi:MFS family permease
MSSTSNPALAHTETLPPNVNRNFLLGVLNGAWFILAETLVAADLVLANFISKLTTSNFLIGLVVPLRDAGWFLPQLFVSSYLQRRDRMLPIYRVTSVVRSLAWLGMGLVVLTIDNPIALLAAFYLLYTVNSLASGISGLSFMDVVAKTIPSRRRGSFFASRLFFGSLLGLAASGLVESALGGRLGVPYFAAVGLLLVLSWVFASIGMFAFCIVREPRGEVREEPSTLGEHIRRAARLPRDNRNFRYLLTGRVTLMLVYVAAPFYGLYATRELGADDRIIGLFLAARTAAFLVANPVWGRLSNRRGNRLVILIALVFGGLMPLAALLTRPVLSASTIPPAQWGYFFVPVFVLWGLFESGVGVGAMNLLLDLAPQRDRAIYIGLTNSILGVALISTSLGGALVDLIGMSGIFVFALACCAVSLLAFGRMREPRETLV